MFSTLEALLHEEKRHTERGIDMLLKKHAYIVLGIIVGLVLGLAGVLREDFRISAIGILFIFVASLVTTFGSSEHPVIKIGKVHWRTYKTGPRAKEEYKRLKAFVADRPITVILSDGSTIELKKLDVLVRPQGNEKPGILTYGWFSLLTER